MTPYQSYLRKQAVWGANFNSSPNPNEGQVASGGDSAESWNNSVGNNTPLNDFSYMGTFHGASDLTSAATGPETGWETDKFASVFGNPFESLMSKLAAKPSLKLLAGGAAGTAAIGGGGLVVADHLKHQHEVVDARSAYRQKMLEARVATSPSFRKLPAEEQQAILDAHRNYQAAMVNAAGHDPLYSLYR